MLEMIRISKNGYSWADVWIQEGCFSIYEKKCRQQGYDVKKTLVKKESELERKSTMSKFDSITGARRENLLMETAMRIQEVFDNMWTAKLLDPDKITDSFDQLQTFCGLAREFENTFYGTDEYDDDFIGLTEEWATKKLTELFGKKGEIIMTSERALAIAKEFLITMNPDGWNGEGEEPSSFNQHIWSTNLTDYVRLDISFDYEYECSDGINFSYDWEGWCTLCELVDIGSNEMFEVLSGYGCNDAESLAATIETLCEGFE